LRGFPQKIKNIFVDKRKTFEGKMRGKIKREKGKRKDNGYRMEGTPTEWRKKLIMMITVKNNASDKKP
jgi:hypothetical protein